MPIRLVVFDIAGTTVKDDDYVARAFRDAFVRNGYEITLEQTYPYNRSSMPLLTIQCL